MMNEKQQLNALEWYGSCEFSELLEIKARLEYTITKRMLEEPELEVEYQKFCLENAIKY